MGADLTGVYLETNMAVLAPPPPRPQPQWPKGSAWVIGGRHDTLFGWHVTGQDATLSDSHVLAFRKQQHALQFCGLLGGFRNSTNKWPDRILRAGDRLEILLRPQYRGVQNDIHKDLSVNRVDLEGDWLERLLVNNICVDIIESMKDVEMHAEVLTPDNPISVYRDNLGLLFER